MSDAARTLVFDTGPIRHFAEAGWLGALKYITRERRVLIPESVERERLAQTNSVAELRIALDAAWIEVDRSCDSRFLAAFARYADVLGGREEPWRMRGSCVGCVTRVRGRSR